MALKQASLDVEVHEVSEVLDDVGHPLGSDGRPLASEDGCLVQRRELQHRAGKVANVIGRSGLLSIGFKAATCGSDVWYIQLTTEKSAMRKYRSVALCATGLNSSHAIRICRSVSLAPASFSVTSAAVALVLAST